jgi:hypothetical protein
VKECKDRVDHAMHATRTAVEEGILPGGASRFCAIKAIGLPHDSGHVLHYDRRRMLDCGD